MKINVNLFCLLISLCKYCKFEYKLKIENKTKRKKKIAKENSKRNNNKTRIKQKRLKSK
jgi:hypothetical protein